MDHIHPLLVEGGRQVLIHGPPTEEASSTETKVYNSLWKGFEDSGLDWSLNRELTRTFLPNKYHIIGYDEQIAKAPAKECGMKALKPNRAYGLAISDIPPPETQPALLGDGTRYLLNAIPDLQ